MRLKKREWQRPDGPIQEGTAVMIKNAVGMYTVLKGGPLRNGRSDYGYLLMAEDGFACYEEDARLLVKPPASVFGMLTVGSYFTAKGRCAIKATDDYAFMLHTCSHSESGIGISSFEFPAIKLSSREPVEVVDLVYIPEEVPF